MSLQNPFQSEIWALQKQIFKCDECEGEFTEEFLGPDSIFVGEAYGMDPQIPKILFIGINPNSDEGDFGTKKNIIQIYGDQYERTVNFSEYYNAYFRGIDFVKGVSPKIRSYFKWNVALKM